MMNYIVHFKIKTHSLTFEAFPVEDWICGSTGKQGFSYIDKDKEPISIKKFKSDKCLMKLKGTIKLYGNFESRLYFTDDEYWGDELSEISELFTKCILPWCKNLVK